MEKLDLSNVTLVCVDTKNHSTALDAMHFCLYQCNFHEALFFTDKQFISNKIKHIPINALNGKIGKGSYSEFMIKYLSKYITSKFLLVVQFDGWIINTDSWTNEFFNYDYIGAKWSHHSPPHNIGNGGFSLRSKKLQEILASDEKINGSAHPEDECIGLISRSYLENKYDIKFPDSSMADRFSCEHDPCDRCCCFGFHYIGVGEYLNQSIAKYGLHNHTERLISPALEKKYFEVKSTPSDMNMFISVLREYTSKCDHVTEFGVKWIVSTWGLLAGKPKKLISYDIVHPAMHNAKIEEVYDLATENNIIYEFKLENTLEAEIEPTELLFIDTEKELLKHELKLHHAKTSKYIICHDSVVYTEVRIAIENFLKENKDWHIKEFLDIWPGLSILERKSKFFI